MNKQTLTAKSRVELKKNKVKKLKSDGFIPCVVYGDKKENSIIYINAIEYEKALRTDYLKNTILDITVEDEKKSFNECVITYSLQKDVIKRRITHVDFMRVNPKTKITLSVPLDFQGVAPGTKRGGVQVKKLSYVKISVLPGNIPVSIPVDVTELQIGEFITIGDLDISNFDVLTDVSNAVIRIEAPRKAVEVEEEAAASGATEATAETGQESADS
jgi:large subunit ribosomal protein L25